MELPLVVLVAVTLVSLAFYHWMFRVACPARLSGDSWYMRRYAFTDDPVSPPYCWRPLVPMMARWVGFRVVSYTATAATPVVIYMFVGGGWVGCACGLMFVGTPHIFPFNVRNPEYADSVGQLLMISSLWAMLAGHPVAYVLFFLAVLCRESLGATLAAIALFVNPFLVIPVIVGGALAYFNRNEDRNNRHPLVEKSSYETLVRWVRVKKEGSLAWPHVFQPLRAVPYAVPFVWQNVGYDAWVLLVGFPVIFAFALPASGQSRSMCYAFGLFLPFVALCPEPWIWIFVFFQWFWPISFTIFDETGGPTFGYAK